MTGERVRAGARAILLCASLAGVVSGCTAVRSTQETVGGWFGAKAADGPSPDVRPRAYYAASARVPVLADPDASAKRVGELALHEGVLRYQVEGGYAWVSSQKGDTKGWVSERALIERLPAPAPARAAKPAALPLTEAAPSEAVAPVAPVDDAPVDEDSDEAEPAEPGAPREKSVFDPY
jgi:hypothetical protein